MVNNSPISPLAGLLDFGLNLSACLAPRSRIYKSFMHQLGFRAKTATSPRIPSGGHYSKLFIQDAELNGKMISTLPRGNSCSILLLEDDRFPFPSSSHSIPLACFLLSMFATFCIFIIYSWSNEISQTVLAQTAGVLCLSYNMRDAVSLVYVLLLL